MPLSWTNWESACEIHHERLWIAIPCFTSMYYITIILIIQLSLTLDHFQFPIATLYKCNIPQYYVSIYFVGLLPHYCLQPNMFLNNLCIKLFCFMLKTKKCSLEYFIIENILSWRRMNLWHIIYKKYHYLNMCKLSRSAKPLQVQSQFI